MRTYCRGVGYSKEGDEVGVGEIGNFRVDVAPTTTSQDKVTLSPRHRSYPGREGGYAYLFVSFSIAAGSARPPANR